MSTAAFSFRHHFLVYCLDLLPNGQYVALNRRYKPVGMTTSEWVDYETLPVGFQFKRALAERQIVALSCKADASAQRIYLYSDSCIPTDSAAHWRAYSDRLELLAGYLVEC